MKTTFKAVLAAAFLGCAVQAGAQQAWPTKPVRLIVTFAPGGAADISGRLFADKLGDLWKQPVIVENRVGAGGRIGVEAVMRSDADGYTLLLASNSHITNQVLIKGIGFDLMKDFAHLGLITSTPMVLAVTDKIPAKNVREFTELVKKNPGKIDYATCGVATIMHFAAELYKNAASIHPVHIPHRGCGPAAAALAGGQIDVAITSMAPILPFARQGKVRMLGLTTADRSPSAPDVPTFRESGLPELKSFAVDNYYGIQAPAAIPREVQARIEADIKRGMSDQALLKKMANAGLDPFYKTPDEMRALYKHDLELFAKVVAVSGMKPE